MMKYVLMMLTLVATVAVYAQSPLASLSTDATVEATVHWDKTTHDFGRIPQHEPQSATFTVTNRSAKPMLITQAVGSCGCTVASYTKEMIAPGEQGTVKATYDAARPGVFTKTVTVITSTSEGPQVLRIKGTVE